MACTLFHPSHGGGRNVICFRGVLLELISHADRKMLHKGVDWKTLEQGIYYPTGDDAQWYSSAVAVLSSMDTNDVHVHISPCL